MPVSFTAIHHPFIQLCLTAVRTAGLSLPLDFMMQIYSVGLVGKYRSANPLRDFPAAFRKSQIGVFREILPPFTCLCHPFNAVWLCI